MSINKILFTLMILATLVQNANAQAPVLVKGEAEAAADDKIARATQVANLTNEARAEAMRKITGTDLLLAEHSNYNMQLQKGNENASHNYTRVVNTFTGGQWLMDTKEPELTKWVDENGQEYLQVKVEGYAITDKTPYASIRYSISKCMEENCTTILFTEGDPLFVKFAADKPGFLTVILEDQSTDSAYILQDEKGFPLEVISKEEVSIPDPWSENYYYELIPTLDESETSAAQLVWIIFSAEQSPINVQLKPGQVPALSAMNYRKWLLKTIVKNRSTNLECIPITLQHDELQNEY
jgi:hypothetical protein